MWACARQLFYERRMMRQEPALHAILREKTAAPVPEIIGYGFGDVDLQRDFVLMERLGGEMLGEGRGDAARTLRELGDAVREVHSIRGTAYGYDGAHRPMEPCDEWGDAFVVMWSRLLDDIVSVGGYGENEAGHLRHLLDEHRAVFDHRPPCCP